MAATIVATNITILDDADAATQWSADRGLVGPDTELYKESTGAMGCTLQAATGADEIWITRTTGTWDLSDTHIRLWVFITPVGQLDIDANGGIQIGVQDASNTGWWNVSGSDTYKGGWKLLQIDTRLAVDSGIKPVMTAITDVRLKVVLTSSPKNAQNLWTDYWHATDDGYAVHGGTPAAPMTWADIAGADETAGYGIVQEIDGVYFLSGPVQIGYGISDSYFKWTTETVVFVDNLVDSDFYGVVTSGSSTEINIQGGAISALADRFEFDTEDITSGSCGIDALNLLLGKYITFGDGHEVTNCKFTDCLQITPNASTFEDNTITQYDPTSGSGALSWPTGKPETVRNCSFTDCVVGIEHPDEGEFTYYDLLFNDNEYDLAFTDTSGSLTINASGASNPTTYVTTSGSVAINNTKSYTLTDLVTGSEVRAYVGTDPTTAVEIDGVESSGTSFQFVHEEAGNDGYIRIHKKDYVSITIWLTYPNADTTIPIQQRVDRPYENP